MNATVIGAGYVGLVTAVCLADFGLQVICIDENKDKIKDLQQGQVPIYEPGLNEAMLKNFSVGQLQFSDDIEEAVKKGDVLFIAVGTPSLKDGGTDLQYVLQAAADIGRYINGYKVVVNKSTVPPGTGKYIKSVIEQKLQEKKANYKFDFVANPEFLRQGCALLDFNAPDRVVLGVESDQAQDVMRKVYKPLFEKGVPFIITQPETAEMIKLAANAFLAMKIAYINELANLCEKVGADVLTVSEGIGRDRRIGPHFLQPGPGFGGSCFPKDTKALAWLGADRSARVTLVEQTILANERQKEKMVNKIQTVLGSLKGKTIGILGITFKANTDDLREAPSLRIIDLLVQEGASLRIYDPQGENNGRVRFAGYKDKLCFCRDEYDAAKEADALVLLTEWPQFLNMDWQLLKGRMKGRFFFDLRNMYQGKNMRDLGFQYYGVGR